MLFNYGNTPRLGIQAAKIDPWAKARAADDLLLEIFARVRDVLDLLHCAGTCSHWFRLISCPAFLRRLRLLPENEGRNTSFLVGAFWQHTVLSSMESGPRISQSPPQFYGLDTLPRSTILVPPPPLQVSPDTYNSVPVVGAITGYALFTAADNYIHGDLRHPQQLAFQVLFTGVHSDRLVYAYSYSSTTNSWSPPLKCSQPSSITMCGPRTGVGTRGFAHWVYTDGINFYTLSIRVDATAVSLTKIPIQTMAFWSFGPCENKHDHSHEYEGEWVCSELMSKEAKGIQTVSFLVDGRGAMRLKKYEQHCFFTLDLDTKKMEPVMWGEDSRLCKEYSKNHVLYEMVWSSYLLQLTAMNQGGNKVIAPMHAGYYIL
uniref:F-box domain-containing protein n=1 Tax=Aegilops tauschii TaxID=37682 RepID=M8CDL4_AEGTA